MRFVILALVSAMASAQAPEASSWSMLQKQYYGERDIRLASQALMSLEVPENTPDPAATPVTLRFGAAALGQIQQLRVFIDNNPSPLASTFDFAAGARVAQIGLQVRVDRLTSVRAIAQLADGSLQMRSGWVNASGGCSSPPAASAGGVLGEMRVRPSPDAKSLLLSIRHPNYSGFQIDPVSGDPIPAHYVTHIRFSRNGETLVEADTGISLSENPTLLIASDQPFSPAITIEVTDSKEARFTTTLAASAADVRAHP